MTNIRVAVLRGGPSEEYEVSMRSGASVLEALADSSSNFHAIDIIISRKGEWLVGGYVKDPAVALSDIDVVFNALHGAYGEDGTVQRILDRLGIPYTGSGAYASGLAMNKVVTKDHLKNTDIKMAPHMKLTRNGVANTDKTAYSIAELFGPHYVIKPVSGGSSLKMRFANTTGELARALEEVFMECDEVIVEQRVSGKEVTVGLVEKYRGQEIYELPEIEIVPPAADGYFNATNKYDGTTDEICPGRFSKEEKKLMAEIAKTAHQTLGLRHYSRTDMILADDGIYFLEINTLPGLTKQSLLPKSIEAVGGSYKDFVEHLLNIALNKY
ncbi:D-alanine--D-alanine ligase [Candidatus Kaiserbacteria bacterium]|nr:D-alanine--D-alanine ligase [Candidatus Kaiserbacteria bacterium]